jgi:sulfide:quinone oxidoreductase
MAPRIAVLGGSFAGLAAAFKLKRDLGERAQITVIARDPRFVFIPSLIWVVPGWRKGADHV